MVPLAANAFHIDCVPITDALRCLKDYSYNLFIQERFPVLDRKYDVVMDLPGAMIPFSDLFVSHEDSVQDVPVASHGELQVKCNRGATLVTIDACSNLLLAFTKQP